MEMYIQAVTSWQKAQFDNWTEEFAREEIMERTCNLLSFHFLSVIR